MWHHKGCQMAGWFYSAHLLYTVLWSFVLDRSDGVSTIFLSSPLLRWISCARWSDRTSGIQSAILVLGFLFRWFQYLRENKEVLLSHWQLRTFQMPLSQYEISISRNRVGSWKSQYEPTSFWILCTTAVCKTRSTSKSL